MCDVRRWVLVIMIGGCPAYSVANCPGVLDQQHVFVSSIGNTANAFSQEVGQTFTVGHAGMLCQIDAYLARFPFTTDNIVFSIYRTMGGLPSTPLGTVTRPASVVSTTEATFVTFDVSGLGIAASLGELLAYGVTTSGDTSVILPYSQTEFYPGGAPVSRALTNPPGPWLFQGGIPHEFGFKTYMSQTGLPTGDFNGDAMWNCLDINALTAAIVSGSGNLSFDMTGDGMVNGADLDAWQVAGGSMNPGQTGGRPFLDGDANLDGRVDGSDFGIWNANKFTANSAWCSGDFTTDGVIDGSDFGIWNGRKFTSSDSANLIPEPSVGWGGLGAIGWLFRRRWRRTTRNCNWD
ncbi:MAG TPA: hypothetical protein VIY86_02565, partial [Pirellulaceae bacterium]